MFENLIEQVVHVDNPAYEAWYLVTPVALVGEGRVCWHYFLIPGSLNWKLPEGASLN